MRFPLLNKINIADIPAANRFGAQRRHDVHTGVDFFCDPGTPVYAIEEGIVTNISWFTGEPVQMPWWEDTMAVAVEGATGVFNYGEIIPNEELEIGSMIPEGYLIGHVKTVLKIDKGLPMTMLHLELYKHGYRDEWSIWNLGADQPENLLNPEIHFE